MAEDSRLRAARATRPASVIRSCTVPGPSDRTAQAKKKALSRKSHGCVQGKFIVNATATTWRKTESIARSTRRVRRSTEKNSVPIITSAVIARRSIHTCVGASCGITRLIVVSSAGKNTRLRASRYGSSSPS